MHEQFNSFTVSLSDTMEFSYKTKLPPKNEMKNIKVILKSNIQLGAPWSSGRASDSTLKGPGFDSYWWHHVVSLCKAH